MHILNNCSLNCSEVPFEQSSIPELRSVSVSLHDDVAGILTYFEKIPLETLEISGCLE